MPTRRQHRLNELLREELVLLVPGRLDDPRLADVVVTHVETTQDMTTAKVYVTCDGPGEVTAEMLGALAHAEGFLRTELASVGLRRLPHLVFARDREYERGVRLMEILSRLDAPEPEPDAEPGA
jgi:ribosome-binding factor A